MAKRSIELQYNGEEGKYYPSIPSYPRGIEISKGDAIKVTEKEAGYFLRQMNGKIKLFTEKKARREANTSVEE